MKHYLLTALSLTLFSACALSTPQTQLQAPQLSAFNQPPSHIQGAEKHVHQGIFK